MKRDNIDFKNNKVSPLGRSNSGNLLAKRLYRNNSLTRLTPLNNSPSMLGGSLNTSLIPSVSLRKLAKLQHSQPSIQISHGKILLRKPEEIPFLSQQGLMKKKAAHRKFQKIDSITQKSILPQDLKAEFSTIEVQEESLKKFKPNKKWLAKLKQGKESTDDKLTPEDFIQLMQEEGGLRNQFCYLQKGDHPYDLRIVQFGGVTGDEYITISARGVTYFNWEGSRFVSLEEWRRQAYLFSKLMSLQFFGKYKIHKNFTNWKKYSRKVAMKKTTDKLKSQLLVHDRHLRQALITTRGLCCRMECETNYCYIDDSIPALPFSKFKAAQETYLTDKFQKRLNEIEEEIKGEVANSLGISMREFKQENKISSGKQGKGLPLLIGDQKNLQMPYTKQATLRVQQQKFKRFLKLIELLVVHSKINMMDEATFATARKLQQQNEGYSEYLTAQSQRTGKGDYHFKGKQYIECQLQLQQIQERVVLRPSREQLTNLMEDIVNRSIIKLVRNHHRIINDPDINAILYEGVQEQPRQSDPTNTLKVILGAEQKQQAMVGVLTRAISTSYTFLENYTNNLSPLVAQYFCNQGQLIKIPVLTSQDFFSIREWMERWRKELTEISKLNQEHESAVFLLNFKAVKETAILCVNTCLSKIKQIVPKILENAMKKQQEELKESVKLMEVAPIGIQIFIAFQHNKFAITNKLQQYEDTLGEIGQLIDIMKELGGAGESAVSRSIKEKKQLGQMMKVLRAKIQQADMHSKVHQSYAQQEVRKMIPKVFHSLASLHAKTKQPRGDVESMSQKISEWEQQFFIIQKQLIKLRQYQRFLGMEEFTEETVHKFSQYFKIYKNIWSFSREVENYHIQFLQSSWKNSNLQEIKAKIEGFLEQAERIKKNITLQNHQEEYQIEYSDGNVVSNAVGDIKKKIRPVLEAIQCLRDFSLEEREHRYIKAQFERKRKNILAQLIGEHEGLVEDLIKEGITEELDFLKKVVFKSKKQLQLNSKMAAVSRFWGQSVGHSSKSLIDNFAQHYWAIAAEIDQKITVINCVRQDPQVEQGQFRSRVQNQKSMFDSLRQLLTQWQKHHNFLSYFQPIFSNPYWKGTSEFKSYAYAESNWKKLTKQISKDFSLRKLATQQKKHLSILKQNNTIFQELKHSVQLFLNAKRQAFPKLYFLSNEQLLHLLLQDKDYASIDKHLSRIFPNLKSLDLNEERNCPLAVRNMANECLPLRSSPAKQVLQLQEGLKVIEQRMKEGIRSGLLKCSNYYLQDDFNRKQWINQNILQVLLFIGNSQFTKLLEYDYLQQGGQDMSQLLSYQMSQIRQLYMMIRDQITDTIDKNYKLAVLLMQAGHFRDIILKLIQLNVRDDLAYEWQREVRSYYNGSQVAYTKYLTKSVEYGYEFICPNYSFTISTLSQKQFIEFANTIAFHYLPVLVGNSQLVQNFCVANARNYIGISLQPSLCSSYLYNLCQGALSSNTYLELKEAQHLTEQTASLISSFIHEARCILQRKQAFYLTSTGKNNLSVPSFNITLRINQKSDFQPIHTNLTVNYRCLSIPQITIFIYMSSLINLAFQNHDGQLAKRVDKACEIVNKCSGQIIFGLQDVRQIVINTLRPLFKQFKNAIFNGLVSVLNQKIIQNQEIKLYQNILREVIYSQKNEETIKAKNKGERDSKNMLTSIVEILNKKQICLLVGPSCSDKKYTILQAYKTSGLGPVQIYHTDFLSTEQLLGNFQNGLWKQGILSKHIKQLTYSQQEWLVFDGQFSQITQSLLQGIVQGELFLSNGQLLYLSPNWKFLFSTDILREDANIPAGCDVIASQSFTSTDQQLMHLLQTVISRYFKTNIQGYSILKNLCLNNFQKILKFRLKGRFLKPQHLLMSFINVIQSVLSKCPQKNIDQKDSQRGIEKLFLWSIYWTVYSTLSIDHAKKFESQLFQQIKIQIDRGLSLSLSRFELDNPQGSFKKLQVPSVQVNNCPFYISAELETISKFIQLLLIKNKNILLIGQGSCGKSQFLSYMKDTLGEENNSFLKIRLNKKMSLQKFQQLLHRKAKIVINHSKLKFLSAINGKRLVLILDDINLLQEEGNIGRFLKSILTLGYYYDHITLQKIYLNNISILAAQTSSYEFNLSYDFTKYFKPVNLPALSIRDIAPLYQQYINPEFAAQICHNVASLFQFITIGDEATQIEFPKNIDIPLRILKIIKNYQGKQNIVKIWQYVSVKEYVTAFCSNESQTSKITAQIKNYSNLMLKNNQQPPTPVDNIDTILKDIHKKYAYIEIDQNYSDYYTYFLMILQLGVPINIFTINEPLCPSIKQEILANLCLQNEVDLIHPFRGHELMNKNYSSSGRSKIIYMTDSDQHFQQIIDILLNDNKNSLLFVIDIVSQLSWKRIVQKYPSVLHLGARYIKSSSTPVNNIIEADFIAQLVFWCGMIEKKGYHVTQYAKQQISRIVSRNYQKISKSSERHISQNKELINSAEEIKQKANFLKTQIDKIHSQLQELAKDQDQRRKDLLNLKNNYEETETEEQKNSRISKIQSIELKLNQIMASKRCNEDQARQKQDQLKNHQKIINIIEPIHSQAEASLKNYQFIRQNIQKITIFFALVDYYYSKNDKVMYPIIEQISQLLPLQFQNLMESIYGCKMFINQHTAIVWLINDKSIIIQSQNQHFAQFIQKRCPKVQIIRSYKELEELGNLEPDISYILFGQLRSQSKYLSDIAVAAADKDSKQSMKGKEESKEFKDDKYSKQSKEDRADYNRHIYFIVKQKEAEEKTTQKSFQISSTFLGKPKDSKEDMLASGRKIDRKTTRLNTFRSTLTVPPPMKKEESHFAKEKTQKQSRKNDMVLKIKCKEIKEGEVYTKNDAELQDFLTVSIDNDIFYLGGKKIALTLNKQNRVVNNITLVCKKVQRTERQYIRRDQQIVQKGSAHVIDQLLEIVNPNETTNIKNHKQDLDNLLVKRTNQQKIIIDKILQNSQKSRHDIGKKDGDFLITLCENIKNAEHQYSQLKRKRDQPFMPYLQLCAVLWNYLSNLQQLYQLFRLSKKQIYGIFIRSIRYNEAVEVDGLITEPQQKVDTKTSIDQAIKAIISNNILCLRYQQSLFSLCLLAATLQVSNKQTSPEYIPHLILLFKQKIDLHTLSDLLNKQSCSKQLIKVIESYINNTGDYIFNCHKYILHSLEFNFQEEFKLLKSSWLSLQQSFVVIAVEGTDPYSELSKQKNCLFVKQNTDHNKCLEIMVDRNLNKLVLVNFVKEESYHRIHSIFQEWPKENKFNIILLFTQIQFFKKCQFSHKFSDKKIIQIQNLKTPQKQLTSIIKRNLNEPIRQQFEKVLKLIFFNQIHQFFKQRLQALKKGILIRNSCFYNSQFMHTLAAQLQIQDSKQLLDIAYETVLQGKQKWFIKESRKYLKKQDIDILCKTFLGDATFYQDHNNQLNYFMGLDLLDVLDRIKTSEGCEDVSRLILPSEGRKMMKFDLFYSIFVEKPQQKKHLNYDQKYYTQCWNFLDSITFESFKNLQSIQYKRQNDILKTLYRKQNSRNYSVYRWIEHRLKFIKSFNRKIIMSEGSQTILRNVKQGQIMWGFNKSITAYLTSLQKRIYHIQEMYNNSSAFKKIRLQYWMNPMQAVAAYLYGSNRKGDILKQQIACKCVVEKEEKGEKGWVIDQIELRGCKYDSVKNCVQVNDKNQNKKITGVVIVLIDKQPISGQTISLPILYEGIEYFKLELLSKVREDFCPWKQKVAGIIKCKSDEK